MSGWRKACKARNILDRKGRHSLSALISELCRFCKRLSLPNILKRFVRHCSSVKRFDALKLGLARRVTRLCGKSQPAKFHPRPMHPQLCGPERIFGFSIEARNSERTLSDESANFTGHL